MESRAESHIQIRIIEMVTLGTALVYRNKALSHFHASDYAPYVVSLPRSLVEIAL